MSDGHESIMFDEAEFKEFYNKLIEFGRSTKYSPPQFAVMIGYATAYMHQQLGITNLHEEIVEGEIH